MESSSSTSAAAAAPASADVEAAAADEQPSSRPITTSVDDDIAAGLASDEEAPSEDTHPSFLGSMRSTGSARQSILPHAAFLAPRRGAPRTSMGTQGSLGRASVLPINTSSAPSSSSSAQPASSSSPTGFHPLARGASQSSRERRSHSPGLGGLGSAWEAPVPGMGSAAGSEGHSTVGGPGASSNDGHGLHSNAAPVGLGPGEVQAYRRGSAPRAMASRDPLLPSSMPQPARRLSLGAGADGYASQSYTKRQSKSPSATPRGATTPAARSTTSTTQRSAAPRRTPPRKYKELQGANRFFCFGRVMTASDNPLPFLASAALMLALPVLWLVFVAPFTWRHVSPAPVIIFAYTWSVAAVNMGVTAWRDPGVLPRYLDPDPPCTAGEGLPLDPEDPLAIPMPRIVRVPKGADLKVKWCETCGTYRPPRASHCRTCDNCVENIDHHCTFLNTCIGRRNYTSFFAFLIFTILTCCLATAFSAVHLYLLTRPTTYRLPRAGFGEGRDFAGALRKAPLSAVMFILPIWVMMPVLVLLSYHLRLVSKNRTTVEQIRINTTRDYGEKPSPSLDEPTVGCCGRTRAADPNPFASRSALRNAASALCRPLGDSWIDRYGRKAVDERKPNPAATPSPRQHQQVDVELGAREKRPVL